MHGIPKRIILPLSFLIALVLLCIFPTILIQQSPLETSFREIFQEPNSMHVMGTDKLGRDVLARVLYGGRNSLIAGLLAQSISISIGIIFGAFSGYFQGRPIDYVITSLMTILFAFPFILFLIALTAALGPGLVQVFVAIGLVNWIPVSRVIRGEFISLRERDFVSAIRALGAGELRIIFKHILPNALPPLIPVAVLGFAVVISAEAGLSFLGLGVQPPAPSWGEMLRSGYGHIDSAWWLSLFPGLFLVMTVLSINYVGEWLSQRFGGGKVIEI